MWNNKPNAIPALWMIGSGFSGSVPSGCSCGLETWCASEWGGAAWEWRGHRLRSAPPPPSSWSAPFRALNHGRKHQHTPLLLRRRSDAQKAEGSAYPGWDPALCISDRWWRCGSLTGRPSLPSSWICSACTPTKWRTQDIFFMRIWRKRINRNPVHFLKLRMNFMAMRRHLQEVCGWFGQLVGEELKVVLVKAAFQMSVHFFLVEGAELADGTCKHQPAVRENIESKLVMSGKNKTNKSAI